MHKTLKDSLTEHADLCCDKDVTADLAVLEEEAVAVDKRWDELSAKVNDRLQLLEDVQEDIHRYQVVLRLTEKTLLEIEQIVSFEYQLILDPKKAKEDLAEVKVSNRIDFWSNMQNNNRQVRAT
mgnify:CR=1 FL=1